MQRSIVNLLVRLVFEVLVLLGVGLIAVKKLYSLSHLTNYFFYYLEEKL